MKKPVIKEDPLYQLLRTEDIKGFNEQRDNLDASELKSGDYRGRDLRNMNADGLDFSNSYFRNADVSGIDFRNTNLEGASLLDAKLSGTYFPAGVECAGNSVVTGYGHPSALHSYLGMLFTITPATTDHAGL